MVSRQPAIHIHYYRFAALGKTEHSFLAYLSAWHGNTNFSANETTWPTVRSALMSVTFWRTNREWACYSDKRRRKEVRGLFSHRTVKIQEISIGLTIRFVHCTLATMENGRIPTVEGFVSLTDSWMYVVYFAAVTQQMYA